MAIEEEPEPQHLADDSWQRAAASMRRWTTGIVGAIAAAALALGVHMATPVTATADQNPPDVAAPEAARPDRDDQVPEPVPEPATIALPADGTQGTFTVTGSEDFATSPEFTQLKAAIGTFEAHGYALGIALVDLDSGHSLRYRADTSYYSASSIKAPFTIAGYEQLVDSGSVDAAAADPLAQRALAESDNDAYLELRDLFGSEAFAAWLADAGIDPGSYATLSELADTHYPHLCPNQELAMWTYAYPYLTGGTDSAQKLTSYLLARNVSPIKAALGSRYATWSKAGWIDLYAGGGVEPATWDSGIVFATSGTYVVSIGSDAPSDLAALQRLVPAIDAAHDALVR